MFGLGWREQITPKTGNRKMRVNDYLAGLFLELPGAVKDKYS